MQQGAGGWVWRQFHLWLVFRMIIESALFRQSIIQERMGNHGLSQTNFTIAVIPPQGKAFNFHRDYQAETDPQPISYPSFLSKDDAQAVSYCNRSNFQFRQFELSFEREHNASAIIFTKNSPKVEDIWKNLAPNETIPLTQGCVFKLGETQFEIKKLCHNFADLEEWDETLHTLTDADPREKGSFNVQNSFNLQNSRMSRDGGGMAQSRRFNPNQSAASSFGFEQEGDCRYCYGRDSSRANPLLNLCECSGSVKYCHYYCLKNWISSRSKCSASDCYEYFEYDLNCEICKKQMNRTTTLKGKKYVLYSESQVHPPFIVMAYRNESSSKVREYIINFDYMQTLTLGRNSSCDIKLKESSIAKEHCELIFSNGAFLLRNLNPSLGSFMRIDSEWDFSLVDNQLQLMIGNHLVRIKEESQSCFWKHPLKLKVRQSQTN